MQNDDPRQPRSLYNKNNDNRQLIIHGRDADPDLFPFFAYIGWGGGALIAPDIVLTAGHCKPDDAETLARMTVQVGKYYRKSSKKKKKRQRKYDDDDNKDDDDADDDVDDDDRNNNNEPTIEEEEDNSVSFQVARAIQHPSFDVTDQKHGEDIYQHDFTILKLDGRSSAPVVSINRNPNVPQQGDSMLVAGMGWITSEYETLPHVLQQVELEYISNDECSQARGRGMTYDHKIQPWHLCSKGGIDNERDSCAYDSGSPMLIADKHTHNHLRLVGLVSWGEECADPDFPAVNARVSDASDWIDAMVCQYSEDPPKDFQCHKRSFLHSFATNMADEDWRRNHLEMILGLAMTVMLSMFVYRRVKRHFLNGFQPLSRRGSSSSYDSVGDTGVEIIT